ncbi:MAG: DegV family protein [Chloroflexota bacterium]|nr:DegV family protein [Chloroflexota bacterium]
MSNKPSVKVVTDSTSDIEPEQIKRLGITSIPLTVLIGDKTYRDGVDITPQEFYKRLPTLEKLPTTSQPSPGLFLKAYEELIADGSSVISIHLSSKLSGTYENAMVAARNFPPGKVRVIDSKQISAGLAFSVYTAVEMTQAGYEIDRIEAEARSVAERTQIFATFDTIEYLKKGGRVGGLKAFMGSLLSIKPLIQVKDGEVQPLEQIRTRNKSLQRLAEIVKKQGKIDRLAILHGDDLDGATELANLLTGVFPLKDIYISFIGPVVGTHTGPRAIGVGIQHAVS